jgi:Predicted esterase
MEKLSETRCFGGVQGVYRHDSETTGCAMTFAVYAPPQAARGKVPALWWLSGLTCTHENAMTKAGAQGWAAKHGIALVFPDTSPRGEGVADDAAFDLGQGAGFYVDATEAPWAPHFRMYSYVACELQKLVTDHFPVHPERQAFRGTRWAGMAR